ncbi:MAG: LPS-assembly protein LptD [Rhodospirillales bacterium]|nr:LPS-assembly protein LptD [Rhodospirillales bacterium]
MMLRNRTAMAAALTGATLLGAAFLGAGQSRAQGLVPEISGPVDLRPTDPNAGPASAPSAPPSPRAAGMPGLSRGGAAGTPSNAPVTFTANEVEYDRDRSLVTARGRVEAFQGERILRADEFTYDRNSGVATARGNVQLLEADGQTVFAESAVLSNRMRDGVIDGLRALLAQNGRMAASGARRTNGEIIDLARVSYSSCNTCEQDPLAPPLWQLRARVATWDQAGRQIRYRDARLEFAGVPLIYSPYFQHPDGSAPRQSGFLSPTLGVSRYLGAFAELPYYWAINDSEDAKIAPIISSRQAPNLGGEYRRRFNSGQVAVNASLGYQVREEDGAETGFAGHIFARGRFSLDETWRTGFDLNRATSETYLRTWRYEPRRVLTSSAFVEGFWGQEGFARIDGRAYQGLRTTDDVSSIPFVLPNAYADYVARDGIGGTWTIDTSNYVVLRGTGTDSRRASTRLRYVLPYTETNTGSLFALRAQGDLAAYSFDKLDEAPNFVTTGSSTGTSTQQNIRIGLDWRLPLARSAGAYGSQLIEPRVQFVTGPVTGSQARVPNEDSIDYEFTDATLFELNRFGGRDRQEGGTRVDAALRAAWFFPNGGQMEALAGRSYRLNQEGGPFYANSGLENRESDWVGRLRLSPVPWLTVLGRGRADGETGERRLVDVSAAVSYGTGSVTGGYLYSTAVPYLTPVREREEVSLSVSQRFGANYRATVGGRYDLGINRAVLATASAAYEDECFILEGRFIRRFAEDPGTRTLYPGNTLFLIRLTLKTVGDFGFRAI